MPIPIRDFYEGERLSLEVSKSVVRAPERLLAFFCSNKQEAFTFTEICKFHRSIKIPILSESLESLVLEQSVQRKSIGGWFYYALSLEERRRISPWPLREG
jgi:hypothetical protein